MLSGFRAVIGIGPDEALLAAAKRRVPHARLIRGGVDALAKIESTSIELLLCLNVLDRSRRSGILRSTTCYTRGSRSSLTIVILSSSSYRRTIFLTTTGRCGKFVRSIEPDIVPISGISATASTTFLSGDGRQTSALRCALRAVFQLARLLDGLHLLL